MAACPSGGTFGSPCWPPSSPNTRREVEFSLRRCARAVCPSRDLFRTNDFVLKSCSSRLQAKAASGRSDSKPKPTPKKPPPQGPGPRPPSTSIAQPESSPDSLVLPLHEVASLRLPAGPPESEDAALAQAGACLAFALEASAKAAEPMTLRQRQSLQAKARPPKGKVSAPKGDAPTGSASRAARVQLEIPVRDESPSAQARLASQLLPFARSRLPRDPSLSNSPPPVALFLASAAAADAAGTELTSSSECERWCLSDTQVVPKHAELVVVVCPSSEQASLIQALVASAGRRPVVLLNPGWAAAGSGKVEGAKSLEGVFDVIYCFTPLAFQGFLGSTSGALLYAGRGWDSVGKSGGGKGSGGDAFWILFREQGKETKRLAVLRRRPDAEELQSLMYANMAAESPVAKSIQFMRSLIGQAM